MSKNCLSNFYLAAWDHSPGDNARQLQGSVLYKIIITVMMIMRMVILSQIVMIMIMIMMMMMMIMTISDSCRVPFCIKLLSGGGGLW